MSGVFKDNYQKRAKYFQDYFGCEIDAKFEFVLSNGHKLEVLRFIPTKPELLDGYLVYVTSGLSSQEQPCEVSDEKFRHIELMLYADYIALEKNDRDADITASILFELANFPSVNKTAFEQGQTYDYGRPFILNGTMEAFYFGSPAFVEFSDIQDKTNISFVLNLVALSRKEMQYKLDNGLAKFLDLMYDHYVDQIMDYNRESCI